MAAAWPTPGGGTYWHLAGSVAPVYPGRGSRPDSAMPATTRTRDANDVKVVNLTGLATTEPDRYRSAAPPSAPGAAPLMPLAGFKQWTRRLPRPSHGHGASRSWAPRWSQWAPGPARAPLLVRVTGTVAPPGDDVWQLRRHGTVARLCRRAALSPARGGPGAVPSHRRRNVQVCGLGSADRQRLPARRRRSRHCPAENLRFDPGPTSESCSVTVMPPPRRAGPGPGLARSGSRSRRPAGPRRRRGGVGDINIGQPRPPLRPAGLS